MTNSCFRLAAALLLAATLLPAQADAPKPAAMPAEASARPAAPANALVIGVVDLQKALQVYPKALKERERIGELAKRFDEQMKQMTKRLDEAKAGVPLAKEGSRERELRQLEVEVLQQQRLGLGKLLQQQLRLEEFRADIRLYEDMEVAIAKVAKDRGVQIVLRKHATLPALPPDDSAGPEQVQDRLMLHERRQVWYAADEVDLTPALIRFLQIPLDASGEPKAGEAAPAGAGAPANKAGGN